METEILKENSNTRMKAMLTGADYRNIYTVGIITAENPLGKKLSKDDNEIRNDELNMYLRHANYVALRVKGKYGNLEFPFIVQNITKDILLKLALKHDQEAFIYSEKYEDKDKKGMIWDYYQQGTETKSFIDKDGNPASTKKGDGHFKLFAQRNTYIKADDFDDYYTQFRGIKFQIPFFDKEYEIQEGKRESSFSMVSLSEGNINELLKLSEETLYNPEHKIERYIWQHRGLMRLILDGDLNIDNPRYIS